MVQCVGEHVPLSAAPELQKIGPVNTSGATARFFFHMSRAFDRDMASGSGGVEVFDI